MTTIVTSYINTWGTLSYIVGLAENGEIVTRRYVQTTFSTQEAAQECAAIWQHEIDRGRVVC